MMNPSINVMAGSTNGNAGQFELMSPFEAILMINTDITASSTVNVAFQNFFTPIYIMSFAHTYSLTSIY